MVKISLIVTATTREELLDALTNAGPDVISFHGEIEPEEHNFWARHENEIPGQISMDELPVEEPPAEPVPVYSKDEVRAELRKVMQTRGSDAMREILTKYGSPKLDGVPEESYPAIIADVQKALEDAC